MFTRKDIEFRSIFVINCLEEKSFKVQNGELLLKDNNTGMTLTKFPFQKILALFIIGHATITTPLIEKCRKRGVYIAVLKPNLRPIFTCGNNAEANFLLRERQYTHNSEDVSLPKLIVNNKISNQLKLLLNTRRKDSLTIHAINTCEEALVTIKQAKSFRDLMGIEGWAAKSFFNAYYQDMNWKQRQPRIKCDEINVTLDIGYTLLFNYIETFVRMFGFDLYCGFYHRQWFKRKSLVCDLMEPFRCIIDREVRKSFNLHHFKKEHFKSVKNEYRLIPEYNGLYYNTFFSALVNYKINTFNYIQQFYRQFMRGRFDELAFPKFEI